MEAHAHEHHGPPYKAYIGVFALLLGCTALTVATARNEIWGESIPDSWAVPIALAIAFTKAFAVMWIFMHVGWGSPLLRVFAFMGFFFLLIMASFLSSDYATRSWETIPGWQDSGAPDIQSTPEIRWQTSRP